MSELENRQTDNSGENSDVTVRDHAQCVQHGRPVTELSTGELIQVVSAAVHQPGLPVTASAKLPGTPAGQPGPDLSAASLLRHFAGVAAIQTDHLQSEFRAVQDVYTKVRLPADLKFSANRQGIKAENRDTASVLQQAARYTETSLKIIVKILKNSSQPDYTVNTQLDELTTCLVSQHRYLQEEFYGLVVQGNFGQWTHNIFRNLQKHTTSVNPELLDTLKAAVSLAAVPEQSAAGRGRGAFRGRGSRGFSQGFSAFNGRGRGFRGGGVGSGFSQQFNQHAIASDRVDEQIQ